MSARRPILVVAGPTATGKTGAALALAERLDGELVGADSVQVYRGFDIGSAKPKAEELRGIPHHLIDILDPDEAIDAMAYARIADAAIDAIHGRGKLPIVVGGTGLYVRGLLYGLFEGPPASPELRAELAELGLAGLRAELERVDPLSAERIEKNDQKRMIRALEVFRLNAALRKRATPGLELWLAARRANGR